jgi:hypothetical protein
VFLTTKRDVWISALYSDVLDIYFCLFHTLRRAGCKISTSILRLIVLDLLKEGKEGIYGSGMLGPRSKMTRASRISTSWVLRFQDNHGLHSRSQTGKVQLSPEKTDEMKRALSTHMGQREFESGELDENFVENGDETHFVMNMDNGKTLAAINEMSIKYADVVSGGVGMTMYVRLSGGARCIRLRIYRKLGTRVDQRTNPSAAYIGFGLRRRSSSTNYWITLEQCQRRQEALEHDVQQYQRSQEAPARPTQNIKRSGHLES